MLFISPITLFFNCLYNVVTDPLEYFLLDSQTGELRTARPLDREALEDTTGVLKVKIRVSPFYFL